MPYRRGTHGMERARSIGHVPIVQNEIVQQRLRSYRLFEAQPSSGIESDLLVRADSLGDPGEPVRWALSFDGSPQEVAVREEYPSTRIGYIQVAGVLTHLDEMLGQATEPFVDPTLIRHSTEEALYSLVLPGSNVCRADMTTVKDSWRAEIFDIFGSYQIEGLSILDILGALIQYSDKLAPSGGVRLARCAASASCVGRDIDVPMQGTACPECAGRLFPTDSLRIHEEVSEESPNITALGRLMSTLEHLTMMGYLSFLLRRQPRALGTIAFLLDGPLAFFGPQAWLHAAMLTFLEHMRTSLVSRQHRCPVIIGVEKTGQFAEHANAISGSLPPQTLMLLPDAYIYSHILTSRAAPGAAFGRDTYYGQKFLYKTARGQVLTLTVPKPSGALPKPHLPSHYSMLSATLALLDRIGTTLYEDALIPVALAHSFASIPLRTGSRVLTLLSRRLLGLSAEP